MGNGSGMTPRRQPQNNEAARARMIAKQQYLRKRRRARRRRLAILLLCAILVLAVLGGAVFYAVRAVIRSLSSDPQTVPGGENKEPAVTVSENLPQTYDTDEVLTVPMTEAITQPPAPPPPDYSAPHVVMGKAVTPFVTDTVKQLDEEIDCPYMIMMDAQTGELIAAKNTDEPIYPASMTKLMTVLVAYENCESLETTFRMTYGIIDPLYLQELSLAGFVGNEDITILDMLYGSALPSGAEASMGLALATCGTEEAFVARMNERAASLGMRDTHFMNCTGAHDPDHYSTLADIAVLMAYIEQDETLRTIFSTYQYTTTATPQHPEGLLLTSTVYSRMVGNESGVCEVVGGKTGYTIQAGQCLATCGERYDTGRRFVCVLAGGDTKWKPVYDTIRLYEQYSQP
ncbi:MAG: hypothetical protein MJ175_04265 [Clostridia bacterium]|nr:hypothetical protein [Clostridia bacterium]